MTDAALLELFVSRPAEWNAWRAANPAVRPELQDIDVSGRDLRGRNLMGVNCYRANFSNSRLVGAQMQGGYFTEAVFDGADLSDANLLEANLFRGSLVSAQCPRAKIVDAILSQANFQRANLRDAILNKSQLVGTDLSFADLTNCRIYGVSAWDLRVNDAVQSNIIITNFGEPEIACDNIEVAQFLHLILNNRKLRDVIDTITSKVVLILGRFSDDCLPFLQSLRERLRNLNYIPVLFDFAKPANRDLTETVSTIAHMSRFIIVDISQPRSVPQELMAFSRGLLSVPVQPLLKRGEAPYGMFADLQRLQNYLPVHEYEQSQPVDLQALVERAESKVQELKPG